MKSILLLLLCSVATFAQDVVFRGTPTIRVFASAQNDERHKLDAANAQKYECVISQKGKKYFWTSRNNAALTRVDAPGFTYFIHNGGGGYVKIFTGNRELAKDADYVENINQGFEVVTYWGRTNSTVPPETK